MNRLSAAPSPPRIHSAVARIARPVLRNTQPSGPPECVFAPQHYEPNYSYPLVVWLHSAGGDEREVRTVMPIVSLRNYVALGVRGPVAERHGYCWPQTAGMIAAAEQLILEAVSRARGRFNVHSQRIYVVGFQVAGTMALRIALRNPELFAGAASLNGPFPEGHAPLARLESARRLKLLASHCRDSLSYPIGRVCQELSLFHAAGMAIHLRQYPCEDELTTQMLHDLDTWLMEQVTGVSTEADQPASLPTDWN